MSRRIVLLQALVTAPVDLQRLLTDLPPALAEQRSGESWSLIEIVNHLVDVEGRYRERLQQVVREERPRLQRILPPVAGYASHEQLHELLQQFSGAREETIAFLKPLPAAAWRRHATHPGWGPSSFYLLVQQLVNHDREHINQARTLKARLTAGAEESVPLDLIEQGEGKNEPE